LSEFLQWLLTSHEMELADFLGLYYSTISRLVNAFDKHQKERPDTNVTLALP